ncbi:MAG TPA: transglutaminase-like domain-containing protein [Pirellulaceae bacterium]|nr:transglutaminase-like domain-containing protein [Pirellulaceae bacterium]
MHFAFCIGHFSFLLLAIAGSLGVHSALAADPALDPLLPYEAEKSSPVVYDVDYSIVVTAPYKTKVLKVWLPLPQSDAGQEVESKSLASFPAEIEPQVASEPVFGNKFAYFELRDPQGAQVLRHRFRVKTWELRWNLNADKVVAVEQWPKSFDAYRRSESQSVVVDDRFRALLTQIVPNRAGPLADLSSVMLWVGDHFAYDHHDASLKADSTHGLDKRRGHCSDYHGFCAAMGRALGHPTRVTYGLNTFPKNSPSHCKLEAYLPPYGWVSFDVSETQRLMAAIKKDGMLDEARKQELIAAATRRLTSGFRDNTWFCTTRGTDYDLVPKARGKVPVVRTAYIEADGVPLADPDPADPEAREFAWMTVMKVTADRDVEYPFTDYATLKE